MKFNLENLTDRELLEDVLLGNYVYLIDTIRYKMSPFVYKKPSYIENLFYKRRRDMTRTGKSFEVEVLEAYRDWGIFRHSNTRTPIEGESYVKIPAHDARRLNLKEEIDLQHILTTDILR